MAFKARNKHWVAEDGSFGNGWFITFSDGDLTEHQLSIFEELNDDDKYDYVYAIMAGESLSEWEN